MSVTGICVENYPLQTIEKLRYSDQDPQGHINNALYLSLIEAGRVDIIFDKSFFPEYKELIFMIAHISIDYLSEINWPGSVIIGTKVVQIGSSSFITEQAIFTGNVCAAVAKTVIVVTDKKSRKKKLLSDETKHALLKLCEEN